MRNPLQENQKHSPLLAEVSLVADKDDDDVVSALVADVVYPFGGVLE